jgi:hypothetical protein
MTDWDLMTEYIHNAMQMMDQAYAAARQLREHATPESFDDFRSQMEVLVENLTRLQTVLNNQEAFALDELSDWLSNAFIGKPSEYRRTPRMRLDTPPAREN